jgi:hypothetical protein
MRCDPDHGGRTVRRSRGRPERHCVPRVRPWFGSCEAQADRWCRGGRAQGPIERPLAARQFGDGGRAVVRNERGSAGDNRRRSGDCRGRERHRTKRRGPPPIVLPRAIAAPLHQRCNVESCGRIAIHQRLAVPAFRFGPLAPRFEEHAEVKRGPWVPGDRRLPVGNRSRFKITALLEQQAKLEPLLGTSVAPTRSVTGTQTGLTPVRVNRR